MHDASVVDDLVLTCAETVDTLKSTIINPSNGINYQLVAIILLAIACLLLLVVNFVQQYMKHGLTIPYLLLQQYKEMNKNKKEEIDTKTRAYCFFDKMVNIKSLDPNKIKIGEKSYLNFHIYHISCVTLNSVKRSVSYYR